jgi:succinyl-diaminopimelate desuccinylase
MHVSRICSELVKIRTENPPDRTSDCIGFIRSFLDGLGIPAQVIGSADGEDNLVTTGPAQPLLLCGHVDVVPAMDDGWKKPPFSGIVDDTFVHGRGATDMKGGCAAILAACEAVVDAGGDLPAGLVFVCDEETGGENGIRRILAEKILSPCDCIIAEPTPALHPNVGQKGLVRLALRFNGTPAHGSLYPAIGTSAIMEAHAFLAYIRTLHEREYAGDAGMKEILHRSSGVLAHKFHLPQVQEILQRITWNPGIISGGEKSNVVAQHCDLEVELRIPWGCDIPSLISEIAGNAGRGQIVSRESHEPSMTDPACPLVRRTCAAIESVQGGPVFPIVQWAASDARHLRKHGFRVIEYGPGDLNLLHAIDERVSIDSLEKASRVYAAVMTQYA